MRNPQNVNTLRESRIIEYLITEYRLFQKERKNDEDHKEGSGQNPDAAEVALDVCVIGIELGWARRIHESR